MKITWTFNRETNFPFGKVSPDPSWFEPIGFPSPWPTRPWIYAVMVSSQNGVVGWGKKGEKSEHPVSTILGGDPRRPERMADLLHMRYLRSFGDCSVGAETQIAQPNLIQVLREPWEDRVYPELQPVSEELERFRESVGLSRHPRNIRYSRSGKIARYIEDKLDLADALFNTPGLEVIAVTTNEGAVELERQGATGKGVKILAEAALDRGGLIRAHERLFSEYKVRFLDCEGGETILHVLHDAGILDEVFVTVTDVVIKEWQYEGVLRIFDFAAEGAELVAEGRIGPESKWVFRRWRFNRLGRMGS